MQTRSTKGRLLCAILVVSSAIVPIAWGFSVGRTVRGGELDFQAMYFATHCLMQGCDPYKSSELKSLYKKEGWEDPADTFAHRQLKVLYVNMPTAFPLIVPFAVLPWGPAHLLWLALISTTFVLAAILMWNVAAEYSLVVATVLVCILVANSEIIFATGNTAGVVVGLCTIAAWCFLRNRFVPAGILCLAACLELKPHDAGFVWLYFLLVGGVQRKRALQTLAVTAVLGLAALLWLSHVAPHWLPEMRSNLAAISGPGGINEPGPASVAGRSAAMVIDLQSVIRIFSSNPDLYNSLSYLVCGILLLVWSIKAVRSRFTPAGAWMALAVAAAFTMLPTYHRTYDAKLLLLAIPACATLWAKAGGVGRLAFALTAATIVMAADIPQSVLILLTPKLNTAPASLPVRVLTALLTGPLTLLLLATTIFYLCAYVRGLPNSTRATVQITPENVPPTPTPA
jgi:hypothetical protein